MAIQSAILDDTRHITEVGRTRCGIELPHGTPWDENSREGTLCANCYAVEGDALDQRPPKKKK